MVQPELGIIGGFSSLENSAILWGIDKYTDPAMLRPDLPAMPGTVFPMNILDSGLQRTWPSTIMGGYLDTSSFP